jgi:multicomponent Na+:H+ antiporter subunit F
MSALFHLAALFLLLNVAAGLLRIWYGRTTADRLLAVQLFGTTGTAILLLLSLATADRAYQTIALVFAVLAGILGVTFTRYVQLSAQRQAQERQHEPN